MVFSSDRQRKAVMAKLKGGTRTRVTPAMRRMPRLPKRVSDFIGDEISRQRKEGRPQSQSIAIAFSKARKKFPRFKKRLELMRGNPNGLSQKRIRRLLILLFGVAVALSILRRAR